MKTTDKRGGRNVLLRKLSDSGATIGMLVIAVALGLPIINLGSGEYIGIYKWIYSAGALLYLAGRVAGAMASDGSVRMRRLRRMQAWAGIAFIAAAAFWFYTEHRLGTGGGILAILRQTIMFSLVGAMIEIISSWLMYSQQKKEKTSGNADS